MNSQERNYLEYILNYYRGVERGEFTQRPMTFGEFSETSGISILDDLVNLMERLK